MKLLDGQTYGRKGEIVPPDLFFFGQGLGGAIGGSVTAPLATGGGASRTQNFLLNDTPIERGGDDSGAVDSKIPCGHIIEPAAVPEVLQIYHACITIAC